MKRLSAIIALFAAVTLTAAEYAQTGTNTPRSEPPSEAAPSTSGTSKSILPTAPQTGYTESFAASFAEFLSDINAIADPAATTGIDTAAPAPARPVAANDRVASLTDTYERLDAQALRERSLIAEADNIIPAALPRPTGIALRDTFLPEPPPAPPDRDHAHGHGHDHPVYAPRSGVIEAAASAASIEPAVRAPALAVAEKPFGGTSKPAVILPMEAAGSSTNGPRVFFSNSNDPVALAGEDIFSGNTTYANFVTINSGAHIMPGAFNTIGEIHFHGGAVFMPGSIWHVDISTVASDRICVWDNLAIQGNPLLPITVNLYSINGNGHQGALTNFNPAQARTWTIAYTAGTPLTITGFDPSYFSINADAFYLQNPALIGLGDFSIGKIGETLALNFTPVPEPGAYALMGFGLAALALIRYRGRRR